ncbi:hypothetical protein ACQBAU_06060 [Propionibacteriaceae bacterium Y2011]
MLQQRGRQRAGKRVAPGDGRPLKPFRWWQQFGRALLHLPPAAPGTSTYSVDVRHWGNQGSGDVKAHLYRDGRLAAESKLPARFRVESGVIEVTMSQFGLKRCHHVGDDGSTVQLTPDPRSAEGRRARLQRNHPALSRGIGITSVLMLVIGIALLALQLAETVTQVPPVAAQVGRFTSPVQLPAWLNVTLAVGAALASTERALRLRFNWALDTLGN